MFPISRVKPTLFTLVSSPPPPHFIKLNKSNLKKGKRDCIKEKKIVETQLEMMISLKMFQGLEISICRKERLWHFKTKFLNIIHRRPYIKKNDRNKVATI